MALTSIKKLAEARGYQPRQGLGKLGAPYDLAVSVCQGGAHSFAYNIYFPSKTIKKARFIDGDRIDILYDPADKTVLLTRVTEGGWKLSGHTGSDIARQSKTVAIAINWLPDDFPVPDKISAVDCTIADSGIMFKATGVKVAKDYKKR